MTFIRFAIRTCNTAGTFAKPASCALAAIVMASACSGPSGKSTEEKTAEAQGELGVSTFEIDKNGAILAANLVVDTPGNKDWENAPNLQIGVDLPSGSSDNSFANGAKEDTTPPNVGTGSIPNNKSDLTRFYVSNEKVGGKDFLYLAWERANTLGTANMDFEFNQSSTLSANGVTPVRTAGDILITFDFAQGGNTVALALHRWVTSGTPSLVCEASNTLPCWGKEQPLGANADGSVNDQNTALDPIPDPDITLPPGTFGEAAINLTDSGVLPVGECRSFGSAHLNSRSSASFTSVLKDFIAPIPVQINNCQPVTINLKKVDPQGNPLGGAVMQLFKDIGPAGLDAGDPQIGSNCTTTGPSNPPAPNDGIGDCTFSNIAENGTYIGHELTAPPGYSPAPDQSVTVTLTNQPQTITLTFTDSRVPGRINVNKKDDAGGPVSGAVFTLYRDIAPFNDANGPSATDLGQSVGTCTTDSTGNCNPQFTSVDPGEYWVVETTVPNGYFTPIPNYQHVTVSLGGAPGVGDIENVFFVNKRKFHKIVIVCQSSNNKLYPSQVSLDLSPDQTSISAAQLPAGVTEAALCGIAQAKFGDEEAGDVSHTLDVNIPLSQP